VVITATPNYGYTFIGWFEANTVFSSANPHTFNMPARNLVLEARFDPPEEVPAPPDKPELFLHIQNELGQQNIGGTVDGYGEFLAGATVVIVAAPADGFYFEGWFEGEKFLSSLPNFEIIMPAFNHIITARFHQDKQGYQSGAGTENDPFMIATRSQLLYFANNVNTVIQYSGGGGVAGDLTPRRLHFELLQDINLLGMEWQPIGVPTFDAEDSRMFLDRHFRGNFNGAGNTIHNFIITEQSAIQHTMSHNYRMRNIWAGFFGFVFNSTIENLTLENYSIDIDLSDRKDVRVGSVAAENNVSIIRNVTTNGSINISIDCTSQWFNGSVDAGGLVGRNDGSIINSVNNSPINIHTIYDIAMAGGLVAAGATGQITNSTNYGAINIVVERRAANAGGILGNAMGSQVMRGVRSFGDITIDANGGQVGGIAGRLGGMHDGTNMIAGLFDAYSSSDINITAVAGLAVIVGGVVGLSNNGWIENIGTSSNIDITIYGTRQTIGDAVHLITRIHAGGVVGEMAGSATIFRAMADGGSLILNEFDIHSETELLNLGGIVGYMGAGGEIDRSFSTIDVLHLGEGGQMTIVGGLAGQSRGGMITNSYAAGNVRGAFAGGLVGYNFSSGAIINSYATGDVYGLEYAGGLAAVNHGIITGSIAIGNVEGRECAGGFVGLDESDMFHGTSMITRSRRYEGQVVVGDDIFVFDYLATEANLNAMTFYVTTLGWNASVVWFVTGLNFADGVLPTLRGMPVFD